MLYFAAASGPSLLSAIMFPYALFIAMAVSGAICGASLAGEVANQCSPKQAAIRFGIGFLAGGCLVEYSYLIVVFFDGDSDTAPPGLIFKIFYLYTVGYLIAGFAGSILTRSRLITAYAAILVFGVGGAIGGAVLVLSFISIPSGGSILGLTLGLLASLVSSGALSAIFQSHGSRSPKNKTDVDGLAS
jgi:hypothetical protein